MLTASDLYLELFRALPVGVTITHFPTDDPRAGVLLAANEAASRNLGVDLTPYVGVVGPEDAEGDYDAAETDALQQLSFDVAVTGQPQRFEALEVVHGPIKGFYESILFPLGGRRVASVFRRVDAEIEARRSLEWAMQAMESANAQLARFAASVAHDLKNPLAGISGNAELLAMMPGTLPDEARGPVDRLMELSALSAELIDGFLAYARQPVTTPLVPVDLGVVVAWVTSVMEDDLAGVGAKVDAGSLPLVEGHEAALRQVVLNLVANSVRYRHPERDLVVTIRAATGGDEEGGIEVAVVDNGIGIAVEDRERVFEWGYRASAAGDRPGTGFGLAACRAVMTHLGADLSIGPAPTGGGTAIVLQFPHPTEPPVQPD